MKYLIASDLHGSRYFTEKLLAAFEREGADMLVLLGDIYYHGPRNPLPEGYEPKAVAELLNGMKEKLVVLKGNCDSSVDTLVSDFDFTESMVIAVGKNCAFLTHGHEYNKDCPPKTRYAAVIYGHFHTGFIEKTENCVYANAGSVSLPKNGTPNSYLTLQDNALVLKTLRGEVLAECNIG
ncbi:MAG: phosphodiesterase [Bacillota bacterium]|nr:MAG: phosphodiesterase [Bacillota bacterium]